VVPDPSRASIIDGPMKGSKTPPETEERVMAVYSVTHNFRETARQTGVPARTAYDIVRRLGGDDLADIRAAVREDLIFEAFEAARRLLPAIDPAKLGSRSASPSYEAAKCFGEIMSAIGALSNAAPKAEDQPPAEIRVFTGLMPSPERRAEYEAAHMRGEHVPVDEHCHFCTREIFRPIERMTTEEMRRELAALEAEEAARALRGKQS